MSDILDSLRESHKAFTEIEQLRERVSKLESVLTAVQLTLQDSGKYFGLLVVDRGVSEMAKEIERLRAKLDPNRLKVVLCECLLRVNKNCEPGPPMIPPTAIDWIGNWLVASVLGLKRKEWE